MHLIICMTCVVNCDTQADCLLNRKNKVHRGLNIYSLGVVHNSTISKLKLLNNSENRNY